MTMRALALAGFIVLIALTRLVPHPANFAPITAMAVFGAIRYRNTRAALIAPLLALLLSDLAKEVLYRYGLSQDWGLYKGMVVVYATTGLIALMGRLARGSRSPTAIGATTLAGSCIFFVITNAACWINGNRYPHTIQGLAICYEKAIPFFRNAVMGDLTYAGLLFGVWALAEVRIPSLRPVERLASS